MIKSCHENNLCYENNLPPHTQIPAVTPDAYLTHKDSCRTSKKHFSVSQLAHLVLPSHSAVL